MHAVLVDAGPLIAVLDRGDPDHKPCVAALKKIREPLVTAWPAFTEAMYLLRGSWPAQEALWQMVISGAVSFSSLDSGDLPRMCQLMDKYRDLPMDLADAALVRVAEREKIRRVLTLDRRAFTVYRPAGLGKFAVLP